MTTATDFWTRRKAKVSAEAEAERLALAAGQQKSELETLEQKTDEEILAELDLPDPEELKAGDDFSAFMKRAVPERLRRRALRKLWLSNPVLANLDGLVDYADDYTDAATVIENMQTSYLVGKGMLTHVLEMTKAEEPQAGTEPDAPVESLDDENTQPTNEVVSIDAKETVAAETIVPIDLEDFGESLNAEIPETTRRMRFTVDHGPPAGLATGMDRA